MKKLFTLVILGSVLTLSAQGLRKKMADDYFRMLAYESAAPLYKDLGNKTIKGKSTDWENVRRAGLSFMLCHNYTESVKMYEALYKAGNTTQEDLHNYAEVLRVLGKYQDAQNIINEIIKQNPNDWWAKEYAQDNNYYTELKLDSQLYKVKKTPFSKGYGDFSPYLFKNHILFTSYRTNTAFVNRAFGWDQTFFVNTYVATANKKGEYKSVKRLKIGSDKELVPHDGPYAISEATGMAMVTMNIPGNYSKTEMVRLGLFYTTIDANTFPKGINRNSLTPFPFNSKEYNVAHAAFSPDGKTLYFSSDMPGGTGKSDIYRSTWTNGNWSTPENLGSKINTPYDDMFPSVSNEGDLFYSSKGWVGLGGMDIFIARHSDGNFEDPENLGYPLNTQADEFGITLNPKGDLAYFSTNRGDFYDRIYETNMYVPEFNLNLLVSENNSTSTPVVNAEVTVKNLTAGTEEKFTTDSTGNFTHKLKRNTNYEIATSKPNYAAESTYTVSTMGKIKSEDFDATIKMKALTIDVFVKVVDKETKQPLTGASVKIKNQSTGEIKQYTTDANGNVSFVSDRRLDYTLNSHFHSHKDASSSFNTNVSGDNSKLEQVVEMEMIKKGDVFVINDIYFDYNKATLRIESEQELNKLADFLLENTNIKVELSAHTDARGAASQNQKLSQKRAQSCVDYLVKKGVPKENIVAKGYGESKLVNRCKDGVECGEEEHQANRRTEIKVLSIK